MVEHVEYMTSTCLPCCIHVDSEARDEWYSVKSLEPPYTQCGGHLDCQAPPVKPPKSRLGSIASLHRTPLHTDQAYCQLAPNHWRRDQPGKGVVTPPPTHLRMPSRRSGRAAAKRAQQALGTFAFLAALLLHLPCANRIKFTSCEPFPVATGFGWVTTCLFDDRPFGITEPWPIPFSALASTITPRTVGASRCTVGCHD